MRSALVSASNICSNLPTIGAPGAALAVGPWPQKGLCPLEVEEDAPFGVQAAATSPNSVIPDTVTSAIRRLMSVTCDKQRRGCAE
jgi:hypothetical protein